MPSERPPPPAQSSETDDPYVTGICRWWHLRTPSPELLEAEAAGVLGAPGVVADLGCGLGTEVGYLAGRGWRGLGVDLSAPALSSACASQPGARFARADVTRLPLRTGSADLLLDRGCFHYLRSGAAPVTLGRLRGCCALAAGWPCGCA